MTYQDSNLPPAGWYEDPENPSGPRRWWDGAAWTDAREAATWPDGDTTASSSTGGHAGHAGTDTAASAGWGAQQYPQGQQYPQTQQGYVGQYGAGQQTADPAATAHQPAPGQHAPDQHSHGQHNPAQHDPAQHGAAQQTPGQVHPGQQAAVQSTPIQETPFQAAPGQPTDVQHTPGQQAQVQHTPIQETPYQSGPGQQTPGQPPVGYTTTAPPTSSSAWPTAPGYGAGYVAAAAVGSQTGFPSVGDTIKAGFHFMKSHWKPLLVITLICFAVSSAIMTALLSNLLDVYVPLVLGEEGPGVGGGFVFALLFSLLAAYLPVLGLTSATALSLGVDGNSGDRTAFGAAGPALSYGFRRSFVFLGWAILLYIALSIVFTILSAILALTGWPVLVSILGLIVIAVGIFLEVKWAFIVHAITDGVNVPFARSSQVSKGRFWSVLVHLLVVGLVFVVSSWIVSGIVSALGILIGDSNTYVIPVETAVGIEQVTLEVPGAIGGFIGGLLSGLVYGFALVGGVVGSLTRMYRSVSPTPASTHSATPPMPAGQYPSTPGQ